MSEGFLCVSRSIAFLTESDTRCIFLQVIKDTGRKTSFRSVWHWAVIRSRIMEWRKGKVQSVRYFGVFAFYGVGLTLLAHLDRTVGEIVIIVFICSPWWHMAGALFHRRPILNLSSSEIPPGQYVLSNSNHIRNQKYLLIHAFVTLSDSIRLIIILIHTNS
jgi:hypothetical protein